MKIITILISLLIVTGFIPVAHSNTESDIDSVNNFMAGKWIWKSCYGGFAGFCTDNPGPHNKRSVIFTNTDTDSVLFEVYKNDTLILSGITKFKYVITEFINLWTIENDVVRGETDLGPHGYYIINKIDSERIEFAEPCIDCYYFEYKRDNILTGFETAGIKNYLLIYPNPVTGKFSVSCGNIITGIEITDITGKIVFSRKYISGSKKIIVNISNIKRGIYFIKSFSYNKTCTGKLLKL